MAHGKRPAEPLSLATLVRREVLRDTRDLLILNYNPEKIYRSHQPVVITRIMTCFHQHALLPSLIFQKEMKRAVMVSWRHTRNGDTARGLKEAIECLGMQDIVDLSTEGIMEKEKELEREIKTLRTTVKDFTAYNKLFDYGYNSDKGLITSKHKKNLAALKESGDPSYEKLNMINEWIDEVKKLEQLQTAAESNPELTEMVKVLAQLTPQNYADIWSQQINLRKRLYDHQPILLSQVIAFALEITVNTKRESAKLGVLFGGGEKNAIGHVILKSVEKMVAEHAHTALGLHDLKDAKARVTEGKMLQQWLTKLKLCPDLVGNEGARLEWRAESSV